MDSVVALPKRERPPLLVGPFERYAVVVDGRIVPNLTGRPEGEDHTLLVVDGRFGATIPNAIVHQVAWLIAEASAVAAGYPHFCADSKEQPFARISMEILPS